MNHTILFSLCLIASWRQTCFTSGMLIVYWAAVAQWNIIKMQRTICFRKLSVVCLFYCVLQNIEENLMFFFFFVKIVLHFIIFFSFRFFFIKYIVWIYIFSFCSCCCFCWLTGMQRVTAFYLVLACRYIVILVFAFAFAFALAFVLFFAIFLDARHLSKSVAWLACMLVFLLEWWEPVSGSRDDS